MKDYDLMRFMARRPARTGEPAVVNAEDAALARMVLALESQLGVLEREIAGLKKRLTQLEAKKPELESVTPVPMPIFGTWSPPPISEYLKL